MGRNWKVKGEGRRKQAHLVAAAPVFHYFFILIFSFA